MNKKRDVTIDIVRSLAIVLMVSANIAILAVGTPPWWLRFTSSMAAPLFISIATMMVILNLHRPRSALSAVYKCIFLFIVAALLDISIGLLPFTNFDVLYLIGISLVIISLVGRFSSTVVVSLLMITLFVTPYFHHAIGYRTDMLYSIPENFTAVLHTLQQEVPRRYLVDGWFPLFPWLAVGFFGALVGKYRYQNGKFVSFAKANIVLLSMILIVVGASLFWLYSGKLAIRYGYIELFYQPTPGFVLVAMGMIVGLIALVDFIGHIGFLTILHPLGEASLFMYIFHLIIINLVLTRFGDIAFGWQYLFYFLLLITVMILIGLGLRKLRRFPSYKKLPHVVRWVIG